MKGGRIALPAEYFSGEQTGNYTAENGAVFASRAQMGCDNAYGPDLKVQNGGRSQRRSRSQKQQKRSQKQKKRSQKQQKRSQKQQKRSQKQQKRSQKQQKRNRNQKQRK